jgi:hypothetical protein
MSLTEADLRQFTGTENYYRHSLFRKVLYSDGVQYLAEQAAAYWLIDAVAAAQYGEPRVRAEEFQVWKLTVDPTHHARLTCEDGNNNVVYSQDLDFTTFPLATVELFFENNVLYLPSEH